MLRFSAVLAFYLLFLGVISAQDPYLDVFNSYMSQEQLFDPTNKEHKFYVNDGDVDIDAMSGNLTYTYPLSSYAMNGTPVNIELNYNSNIQFSSYSYQTDMRTHQNGGTPPKHGWKKFVDNKPLWMISVNGFVVSSLSFTSSSFNDPSMHSEINNSSEIENRHEHFNPRYLGSSYDLSGQTFTYNNQNMIWTVDGLDIMNEMHSAQTNVLSSQIHTIKILRSNGGLLELIPLIDENTGEPTKYYIEKGTNAKGWAIVEEIDNQDNSQGISVAPRILRKPRKITYFPGDGMKYIFREYLFVYGKDLAQGNIVDRERFSKDPNNEIFHNGDGTPNIDFYKYFGFGGSQREISAQNLSGPKELYSLAGTVFYLDEIHNDIQKICDLTYLRHKGDGGLDLTTGRAFIERIGNVEFEYHLDVLENQPIENGSLYRADLYDSWIKVKTPKKIIELDLSDLTYAADLTTDPNGRSPWLDSTNITIFGLAANCYGNQFRTHDPPPSVYSGKWDIVNQFRERSALEMANLLGQRNEHADTYNSQAFDFMYDSDDGGVDVNGDRIYVTDYSGDYSKNDGTAFIDFAGPANTNKCRYYGFIQNVKSITEYSVENDYNYVPEIGIPTGHLYSDIGLTNFNDLKQITFEYEKFFRKYSFDYGGSCGNRPTGYGFPRAMEWCDNSSNKEMLLENTRLKYIQSSKEIHHFDYYHSTSNLIPFEDLGGSNLNLDKTKALNNVIKKHSTGIRNTGTPHDRSTDQMIVESEYAINNSGLDLKVNSVLTKKDLLNNTESSTEYTFEQSNLYSGVKKLTQQKQIGNKKFVSGSPQNLVETETVYKTVTDYYYKSHDPNIQPSNDEPSRADLVKKVTSIEQNGVSNITSVELFKNTYNDWTLGEPNEYFHTNRGFIKNSQHYVFDYRLATSMNSNYDISAVIDANGVQPQFLPYLKTIEEKEYDMYNLKYNNISGEYRTRRFDYFGALNNYRNMLFVGEFHNYNTIVQPDPLSYYPVGLSFDESIPLTIAYEASGTDPLQQASFLYTFKAPIDTLNPNIVPKKQSTTIYDDSNNESLVVEKLMEYDEDHVDGTSGAIRYNRTSPKRIVTRTEYDSEHLANDLFRSDTIDIEYSTGWLAGGFPTKVSMKDRSGISQLENEDVYYQQHYIMLNDIDFAFQGVNGTAEDYNAGNEDRKSLYEFEAYINNGDQDSDNLPVPIWWYAPTGKVKTNTSEYIFNDELGTNLYDFYRSKPAGSFKKVRKFVPNDPQVKQTVLPEVFQYDYYGNVIGYIDNNGWLYRNEFDSFGIIKQTNQPGDYTNPTNVLTPELRENSFFSFVSDQDNVQVTVYEDSYSYTCEEQNMEWVSTLIGPTTSVFTSTATLDPQDNNNEFYIHTEHYNLCPSTPPSPNETSTQLFSNIYSTIKVRLELGRDIQSIESLETARLEWKFSVVDLAEKVNTNLPIVVKHVSSGQTFNVVLNQVTGNRHLILDISSIASSILTDYTTNGYSDFEITLKPNIYELENWSNGYDIEYYKIPLASLETWHLPYITATGAVKYKTNSMLAKDFMSGDFTQKIQYTKAKSDQNGWRPETFLDTIKVLSKIDDQNHTSNPMTDFASLGSRFTGKIDRTGFQDNVYSSVYLKNGSVTTLGPINLGDYTGYEQNFDYDYLIGEKNEATGTDYTLLNTNPLYSLSELNSEFSNLGELNKSTGELGVETKYYSETVFPYDDLNYSFLQSYITSKQRQLTKKTTEFHTGLVQEEYLIGKDKPVYKKITNVNTGVNKIVTATYDELGNMTSFTDAEGNTVKKWYDERGLVICEYNRENGYTSYAYDLFGNLRFSQTQAEAENNTIAFYEYDDLKRLLVKGHAKIDVDALANSTMKLEGRTYSPNDPVDISGVYQFTRITDVLNPDILHDANVSGILTANKTMWEERMPFDGYMGDYLNYSDFYKIDRIPTDITKANEILGRSYDKPIEAIGHKAYRYEEFDVNINPNLNSNPDWFENIQWYPNHVFSAYYYDEIPEKHGTIWKFMPDLAVWNTLFPEQSVRNLVGNKAIEAYRTSNRDPYTYKMFSYDERGRLEAEVKYSENLGFDAIHYRYNSANQLVYKAVIDPLNRINTWYVYDDAGRLSDTKTTMDGDGHGILNDGSGNVTPLASQAVEPAIPIDNEISYAYNGRGVLKSKRINEVAVNTVYSYDKLLNITNCNLEYDFQTPFFSETVLRNYTTNQIDQISTSHFANSFQKDFVYDDFFQLESYDRTLASFQGIMDEEDYQYDLIGNRTSSSFRSAIDQGNSPHHGNSFDGSYIYDPNTGRLKEYRINEALSTQPLAGITTYEYKADGALEYRTTNRAVYQKGYNITDVNMEGQTGEWYRKSEYFDYSPFKRLHRYIFMDSYKDYTQYIYDPFILCDNDPAAFDQLSQWRTEWRYRYDDAGMREQKRLWYEPTANATTGKPYAWEYSLRDDAGIPQAIYHGYEFDSPNYDDGGDTLMHNIVAPYPYPNKSWSPGQGESHTSVFMFPVEYNLVSSGDVEMKYKYDEVADIWFKEYLLKDHMGNIRQRIKWDGLIETNTQLMDYLPFGETRAVPGTSDITDDWTGWLGNSHDYESDLSDFNARMYDPEIGRFMAVDELWGEQLGVNSYHYGHNNPISMADPSGYDDYYIGGGGSLFKIVENEEADNVYFYDKDLSITNSLKFPYGTIFPAGDDGPRFVLGVKDQDAAFLIYETLALNYGNDVEYALWEGTNFSLLGTDWKLQKVGLKARNRSYKISDMGLIKVYHSHPSIPGTENYRAFPSPDDVKNQKEWFDFNPNIKSYIGPTNQYGIVQYYQYDYNYDIWDAKNTHRD